MDNRIPVTLLTGFLGSGKTTLLNKLLHHPHMKDTAVIINELGEAGLDQIFANSQLSQSVESQHIADNTVLLESGCLCCSLKNELADTMRDLFFKRSLQAVPQFNRLVIETTGMADPGPIMGSLLNEPVINSVYRLDAVVVTIDAIYGEQQLTSQLEAKKQAAVADVLLITKCDLATKAQLEALSSALSQLNPGATQYQISQGKIDPASIVNVGLFSAEKKAQPQKWLRAPTRSAAMRGTLPQKVHDDEIVSFTVSMPKPLTWSQLEPALNWLTENFSAQLLRLKGIIHAEDAPAPLAIHAVHQTLYPPTLLDGWEEDEPISRIVFIGKGLDEPLIRKAFTQI